MREKIIEKLLLLFFDSLVILGAFASAYFFRLGTFSHSEFLFFPYITMGLGMIPFWILFLLYEGRYSLKEKTFFQELKIILFSSLSASLLFPLIFYFTNERFFSRGIIVLLFVFGSFFLLLTYLIEKKISQYRAKHNHSLSKMLIIGSNRSAENIIHTLLETNSHYKPVAILSPYGSKRKEICNVPILGKLDALEKTFFSQEIDEIFLCEGIEHSENLSSFCRNQGIPLRASFETLGIALEQTKAETIEGITFLTIQQSPLFGWGQFFKRAFDMTIALLGLILFAPYFLIHRKELTTQKFQNGKKSTINGYVFQKKKKYFGHNIALLLNVLKKEMSIVGPKAMTTEEYEYIFADKKEQSSMRFILRPGIFSPHDFHSISAEKILRSDLLYIRNWNFFTDIVIFIKKSFL